MIENGANAGFGAWMGFAFLARGQDLTWGIHQSISAGRPKSFLGGPWLLRINSKIGICYYCDPLWESLAICLKQIWKTNTRKWHLWWLQKITTERNWFSLCVHAPVGVSETALGDDGCRCGCLWVPVCLHPLYFTNSCTCLELCFNPTFLVLFFFCFFHWNYLVSLYFLGDHMLTNKKHQKKHTNLQHICTQSACMMWPLL